MNQQSPIGVDIGSKTSVIGIAQKAGVEVIVNEASNRETPVVVGFKNNQRAIGE